MHNTVVIKSDSDDRHWAEITPELEWVIVQSLRYEYGRHTASTGDTARWVSLRLLELFHTKALYVIWQDIEVFKERRERWGADAAEVYENDVAPFLELQEKAEKILEKRGYQIDARCGRMLSINTCAPSDNCGDNNSNSGDN